MLRMLAVRRLPDLLPKRKQKFCKNSAILKKIHHYKVTRLSEALGNLPIAALNEKVNSIHI